MSYLATCAALSCLVSPAFAQPAQKPDKPAHEQKHPKSQQDQNQAQPASQTETVAQPAGPTNAVASPSKYYRATLMFTGDTCPFNDYLGTRNVELQPFGGPGLTLPLPAFDPLFTGPVTLQGPPNLSVNGGGVSYAGPVNASLMGQTSLRGEFSGVVDSDARTFNITFQLFGTFCSISGTVHGERE